MVTGVVVMLVIIPVSALSRRRVAAPIARPAPAGQIAPAAGRTGGTRAP
jgi:hypothetical protein